MKFQDMSKPDPEAGTGIWKTNAYEIEVDPKQDDKATEIKLFSFARPHMRAFHCSWGVWVIAFSVWFAIVPLLSEIQNTIPSITKQDLWTSNIISVSGTCLIRFLLGPACDKYGARILFNTILCVAAIPCALTGTIQSATGLIILRLFIGIAGGGFVLCQFWSSSMFTKEIVGTANAYVAGWGNVGGGLTQLLMGSILFPSFKNLFDNGERTTARVSELAWRTVSIVPATLAIIAGIMVYFISDDTPKGNYKELKRSGDRSSISTTSTFWVGAKNINTWILFFQYFCCFGVELTMNNAAALYFRERFGQTTENAAAIASLFGWMNIFARLLGGSISDKLNSVPTLGMRGRILVLTTCLYVEGLLVFIFANTTNLVGSIVAMIFLSIFTIAAGGATFGIVPYVDKSSTGTISGIVGAGGNVGAICFGLAFRELPNNHYQTAFSIMGASILASALLSFFTHIKGHPTLFSRNNTEQEQQIKHDDDLIKKLRGNICTFRFLGTFFGTILVLLCLVLYQFFFNSALLRQGLIDE